MGTYAESQLADGERIVLRERQHWLALVLDSRASVLLWGGTILAVLLIALLRPEEPWRGLLTVIAAITLLVGLAHLAWRWWEWRNQEFVVTNRRLLNTSGIINKRSADSSLEKINDAVLQVNLLGRLLGYGDLKILTAAETGIDRYHMLNRATAFKKAMLSAKHELQLERGDGEGYGRRPRSGVDEREPAMAPAPPIAPPAPRVDVSGGTDPLKADTPDEVAAVLAELTKLRDAGHISSGEYEVKKQELLDRL